jgi:hypothetical protein
MMRWVEDGAGVERCDEYVCDKDVVEKELSVVCLSCESSCQTEGAIRCAATFFPQTRMRRSLPLVTFSQLLQLHSYLPLSLEFDC